MSLRQAGLFAFLFLLAYAMPSLAVNNLYVKALFTDKAMVSINGKNRLLVKGKPSPEGVELISANHKQAVLKVDGKERVMTLGTRIAATYSTPEKAEVRIIRNSEGSYVTSGMVNGRTVEFLVDTGATSVAMSDTEARRLGIDYKKKGQLVQVNTAGGSTMGYLIDLDSVRVGVLEVRNVKATVIQDAGPQQVLLGMTFLNQLEMVNQGNLMLLRARY